jgi:hypothetical protein
MLLPLLLVVSFSLALFETDLLTSDPGFARQDCETASPLLPPISERAAAPTPLIAKRLRKLLFSLSLILAAQGRLC